MKSRTSTGDVPRSLCVSCGVTGVRVCYNYKRSVSGSQAWGAVAWMCVVERL